jgi:hypothetical protein
MAGVHEHQSPADIVPPNRDHQRRDPILKPPAGGLPITSLQRSVSSGTPEPRRIELPRPQVNPCSSA